MLTTLVAAGQNIDFTSLKTEPFSNVTHFRVRYGQRSMRITHRGEPITLLRRRLSSNFYDDSVAVGRYVIGELVRKDPTSPDGWSAISSGVKPSAAIMVVAVFVDPGPGQALYGRSWVQSGVNPEEFLREILAGLR